MSQRCCSSKAMKRRRRRTAHAATLLITATAVLTREGMVSLLSTLICNTYSHEIIIVVSMQNLQSLTSHVSIDIAADLRASGFILSARISSFYCTINGPFRGRRWLAVNSAAGTYATISTFSVTCICSK